MQRTAVLAATALLALVLAVLAHLAPSPTELVSAAAPAAQPVATATCSTDAECGTAVQAGDDNADGTITEDESGFDCSTMGNFQCGIGNDDGPVLLPAADGGEGYFCPGDLTPKANELGAIVCDYSRAI